jgi:hypothetical protein
LREQKRLEQLKSIKLPVEPASGPEVAEIAFRASSGKKISRRFLKTDSVKLLYDFVRTLEAGELGFEQVQAKFELI